MTAVRMVVVLSALAGGLVLFGCSRGEETAPSAQMPIASSVAQELCPVMGEPIDQGIFIDHGGRRVYFCCPKCVGRFTNSPDSYAEELGGKAPAVSAAPAQADPAQGVVVAQKTCPVMDMPISKAVYTDYEGKRVYFCCEDCIETFTEDTQKYLQKLHSPA